MGLYDFDDEEIIDLDEEFGDVELEEKNCYIADSSKAVELVSQLIKNTKVKNNEALISIKKDIEGLFKLFEAVSLENEVKFYDHFMLLYNRLQIKQKVAKINNKVVIGFGGSVSAGKSYFINKLSGIGEMLPTDQKTTTAIPTYIIKSNQDKITVNSVYGYDSPISTEALNAIAHEFNNTYGIGFPPFVDSIVVESSSYSLPSGVALLDTPGYTKYDEESNSKMVVSDKERAFEQLSISDYLIWLIDSQAGTITLEDINFLSSLHIETPILIVFTKADLSSKEDLESVIAHTQKTVDENGLNCFGVTAYSAFMPENFDDSMIKAFINNAKASDIRHNDIINEINILENEMQKAIENQIRECKEWSNKDFKYISKTENILELKAATAFWGEKYREALELTGIRENYKEAVLRLNEKINTYIKEAH